MARALDGPGDVRNDGYSGQGMKRVRAMRDNPPFAECAKDGHPDMWRQAASPLSRTLKNMERYGLVRFEQGPGRQLAPRVNYSGVALEMSFSRWG